MSRIHSGAIHSIVFGLLLAAGCRAAPQPLSGPVEGVAAPRGEDPPIVDTLQPPARDPGPARWRPAGRDERLMWREGGSELGFAERPCARQGNCGCELASAHHYRREGGRWKITVITPHVEIRKKVVRGTCGMGCGAQAPPQPRPVRSLGAVAPEDVEIVEEHPRMVITVTTCTDPIPVP